MCEPQQELLELLTGLIRIDSCNPPGRERAVCQYLARILEGEGIECQMLEKAPGRTNLVAKLPASPPRGQKPQPPILLLSHLDVVPAPGEWTCPPFSAQIRDGVLYGRGALDTKHLTAMELLAMLRLKREGRPLNRELILVASADEEAGSGFGMDFLTREHPELFPQGYTLSEGGGFVIRCGERSYRTCTCGEKGDCGIQVTVRPTGETPDSLGRNLLEALCGLSGYQPQETLCQVTQRFEELAGEDLERDPTLRNLWQYATQDNLVINRFSFDFTGEEPQAQLSLSFKFIPGQPVYRREQAHWLMGELLGGKRGVEFAITSLEDGYQSSLDGDLYRVLEQVSHRLDPGTVCLPVLALGRTDGRFLGRDVYGYSPLLGDLPFSQVLRKVHQQDECITLESLWFGGQVVYQALRQLCTGGEAPQLD